MNQSQVDEVVNAVLYEGYMLYPYRPSSTKNRQRFTFGRVYPRAYSRAQQGAEPCTMQTQCLVKGKEPRLSVTVRFLHPMAREVGRLPASLEEWPEDETPDFEVVPELRVGDDIYQTWQEAVEQEAHVPPPPVQTLTSQVREIPFFFPASRKLEPIRADGGPVVGVLLRRQRALEGRVEIAADPIEAGVFKITVRVLNDAPLPEVDLGDHDEIIMRTFASTHTILEVQAGAFISLMDPPADHAEAAAACENDGTWPVLVGQKEKGERDTMLSSPIIMYDYPEIAPESPGTFFDSTEIDELLTLRIMTMTDDEKRRMRQADERGRQLLERTETLPEEHLQKLHGAIRGMRPLGETRNGGRPEPQPGEESSPPYPGRGATGAPVRPPCNELDSLPSQDGASFFEQKAPLKEITIDGERYATGARVRIHPKRNADIMDLVLEGKTAVIEAIEQDFEDRVYLALVPEDDPGRDLGMMRQPGHRFFFSPDEVERLPEEEGT